MIPRVGEAIKPGMRYVQRPGAYAVLLRGGRLLVTHQRSPVPEFQLPGGGIDPGESPLVALAREVREETGWSIAFPRKLGAFRRFTYMPEYETWAEKVCHIYLARPTLRQGPPSEPGHTAHWMDPDLAADLLGNEGDRMFVRRISLGVGV